MLSKPSSKNLAHDAKTQALARLFSVHDSGPVRNLLVVGCGSGVEAAILGRELQCAVTGIDLERRFDPVAASITNLEVGDATSMRFGDESFDFVFSYHALEHIPDYRKALGEMRRVLRSDGRFCVGTPNRARLVGYLGSKDATLSEKLAWNIADWRAMVAGRFTNEAGAHAGFTSQELEHELRAAFGDATDISMDYYRAIYPRQGRLIGLIGASGLGMRLLPSIYFLGYKRRRAS